MALLYVGVLLDKSFIKPNVKQLFIKSLSIFIIVTYFALIYMSDSKNVILYILQTMLFFYPVLIAFYVKQKQDIRIILGAFTLISIVCLFTASVNIFWLSRYPNTARSLGHGSADPEYLKRAMSYGIGGFGFVYGAPILFCFILFYKKIISNIYLKIFAVVALIVLGISTVLSRYFIAILLLFIALLFYIIFSIIGIVCKKNKRENKFIYTIIVLIILFFILFVFKEALFNAVIEILNNINLNDYALKVESIKNLIVNLEWDSRSTSRINQYMNGLKSIYWSPLTGSINSEFTISRHSDVIDMFAGWGVVWGIVLLWLIYYLFRDTYIDVIKGKYSYVYKFTLFLFVFLACTNTINYSREAAIIIALLPLYTDPKLIKGDINE